MDEISCKLTVYFEDPFWIGVFEEIFHHEMRVAKVTFGKEPPDGVILFYVLKRYQFLKFSPAVEVKVNSKKVSFKRQSRLAQSESRQIGVGTKAMQAMALQHEKRKEQRITQKSKIRQEKQALKYALKQQKRKQKHRGH